MIAATFNCGHVMQLSGDEEQPRCACGEMRIASVKTRAPRFRGHARGPVADFEDLPAIPVKLGK